MLWPPGPRQLPQPNGQARSPCAHSAKLPPPRAPPTPPCSISVTFKDEKDGSEMTVQAPLGKSLLEVAHENGVELEGACEGSLACSTCHVIVEDQVSTGQRPRQGWSPSSAGGGGGGAR